MIRYFIPAPLYAAAYHYAVEVISSSLGMLPVSPTLVGYSAVADDRHTFLQTKASLGIVLVIIYEIVLFARGFTELEKLSTTYY